MFFSKSLLYLSPNKFFMQKLNRLLYLLAIIKLVLPFFLQNAVYEPHRDEFLYLAEGKHMAWGFMEVPPLLSVFAWLTNLFGGSMFWIKFWPSLFGALTFILVGKIIHFVGRKIFRTAAWLSSIYYRRLPSCALFVPAKLPRNIFLDINCV